MEYSIFLRGINTGGMKLLMSDFAAILMAAGCRAVKTIQAAGTAVFEKPEPIDAIWKAELADRLKMYVGKPVHATFRTKDELSAALKLADTHRVTGEDHIYVMLTDDDNIFDEMILLHQAIPYQSREKLIRGSGCFIWIIPQGETLAEFGSKVLGSAKYSQRLTSRNANTIRKTIGYMSGDDAGGSTRPNDGGVIV